MACPVGERTRGSAEGRAIQDGRGAGHWAGPARAVERLGAAGRASQHQRPGLHGRAADSGPRRPAPAAVGLPAGAAAAHLQARHHRRVLLPHAVRGAHLGRRDALLPALRATLHYFAGPENNLSEISEHVPDWMGPSDEAVVRTYFEGTEGTGVPWSAWIGPLSLWLVFFSALFGLLIALAALFHPEWEQSEHLNYPLAELPMRLIDSGVTRSRLDRSAASGSVHHRCIYNCSTSSTPTTRASPPLAPTPASTTSANGPYPPALDAHLLPPGDPRFGYLCPRRSHSDGLFYLST